MNIQFQSTPNIEQKMKMKHHSSTPLSLPNMSAYKNEYNKKRPLETTPQNLSFKGLFYKPILVEKTSKIKEFKYKELLDIAKEHLGPSADTLFNSLKNNLNDIKAAKKLITINEKEGTITFQKKTVLRLILDGIAYPFVTLPLDILSSMFSTLGKIKPLKSWADKIYNTPALANSRQRSKLESKANALRGLFESIEKHKDKSKDEIASELFQSSVKMFDPKTGNYDTKHERSLCRIVSGVIPAFFLANDAYNLSRMYNDNKKDAEKEQKSRFKQEVIRVGANAYLTLITLGAIQKYINNSKLAIMLNTGLTVLFTESIARLASGKSLTRLTPEQAKAINSKGNAKFAGSNENNKIKKAKNNKNTVKKENKEPLLSFNTLLKASALIIATGFSFKYLRKFKPVDELYKGLTEPFKKLYRSLSFENDAKIDNKQFETLLKKLNDEGFGNLSKKYSDAAQIANKLHALKLLEADSPKDMSALKDAFRKEMFSKESEKIDPSKFFNGMSVNPENWSQKMLDDFIKKAASYTTDDFMNYIKNINKNGSKIASQDLLNKTNYIIKKYDSIYSSILKENCIHIGQKDRKIKPLVNFVIAPFKFIYGVAKFPYTITEKLLSIFAKKKEIKFLPTLEEKNANSLTTSIDKLTKASEKYPKKAFKDYIDDNLLKAFNVENMSNVSNSELANLAKTSATAATIWFLMTDNYNMAMIKSNGEDIEGAEEKFKSRFVQEGSRLFYQTLLIDLFNSTFRTQYNNSLWGMSWITASNTFISEILNRKSIGMPVLPHTKKELDIIETNKENATGFERGYYDFMARLTGKKTLAERKTELKKHN